ncbi:RnfABCDGE type electron transport complex subunit G [Kaarinaea lacus]
MTDAVQTAPPVQNNSAMIRVLSLVAAISGVLVVFVVAMTQPLIAENQRIAVEQAIFRVIPDATLWHEYRLGNNTLLPAEETGDGLPVYAGFNKEGDLQGIATEAAAQGYADTIRLLYGYNPKCECITGIKILKSAETPGLGDKIFRDKEFIANFMALDARLNEEKSALGNPIVTVKHGKKTKPWQIDAISGATISSRAIGKALNNSTQYLLPKIALLLSNIERPVMERPAVEEPGIQPEPARQSVSMEGKGT